MLKIQQTYQFERKKNVQIFNVKKLKVVLENFLFVPDVMLHDIALLIVKKNIGKMDMNTNASHKNILKNVQIVKNVKKKKTYFFFVLDVCLCAIVQKNVKQIIGNEFIKKIVKIFNMKKIDIFHYYSVKALPFNT